MDVLLSCLVIISQFNIILANTEELLFNVTDIFDNGTIIKTFNIILNTPPDKIPKPPTDHAAIQIIIFAALLMLLILIGLLSCSICCKHYRRRNEGFFARSASLTSIQELIRERLQDRPPSYHESQNSINTAQIEQSPPYNNTNTIINHAEVVTHSTHRIPTSPPVYSISSKMSTTYANNVLDSPYTECESDTDSPPSYHVSEGVVNPVLLHITNNSIPGNNITQNSLPNNEVYI